MPECASKKRNRWQAHGRQRFARPFAHAWRVCQTVHGGRSSVACRPHCGMRHTTQHVKRAEISICAHASYMRVCAVCVPSYAPTRTRYVAPQVTLRAPYRNAHAHVHARVSLPPRGDSRARLTRVCLLKDLLQNPATHFLDTSGWPVCCPTVALLLRCAYVPRATP